MKTGPINRDIQETIKWLDPLWPSFLGQRLFLTGGTGFFGGWLLSVLAAANEALGLDLKMTVLSRDPDRFIKSRPDLAAYGILRFVKGDVRSFEFPTGSCDMVIHAATDASAKLNAESPLVLLDTAVEGTRRVLEYARFSGAKNFLLTSSGAVYGRQPSSISHLEESFSGAANPLDPLAAYGEGKRLAELLSAVYSRTYGIETKIARCFAFVGPHLPLDAHYAVGNFVRDGLAGGPIRIAGDGTPFRSYMYPSDLVEWLLTILVNGQSARAYNVGSDKDLTISDLARRVAQVFRPESAIETLKIPTLGSPPERYVPSIARARDELGLQVRVGLDEAIRRTVAFRALAPL